MHAEAFEIEEALLQHHDIMECAAYAIESELTEDEIMVSVVVRPGSNITEAGVHEFALNNLGRHQIPLYIEFVQTLPRTPTGKVEVGKLRTTFDEYNSKIKRFSLPERRDMLNKINK